MLIVLRGNSGSGKSTVVRLLQTQLPEPVAVLDQDDFHRVIFREQGTTGMAHALLQDAAVHCRNAGQHVVMNGIFNARQYEDLLARTAEHANDARFDAFDLTSTVAAAARGSPSSLLLRPLRHRTFVGSCTSCRIVSR